MVEIGLWILSISNQHMEDPSEDIANRASPGYVGRLISAMVSHCLCLQNEKCVLGL